MDIEEIVKQWKQANETASEAIATPGDEGVALWDKANTIEGKIQTGLDFLGASGLFIEWSTAYSEYIIRVEKGNE